MQCNLPDGKQRRTDDGDHEDPVDCTKDLTADGAEPHVAYVGDAV
jgi:hypothetical protein